MAIDLVEFDMARAIVSLDKGQPVIPVWLDVIYQQLNNRLNEGNE
jgi:hypothetical protein